MVLDIAKVRNDFPLLKRRINGQPIIYLDSAATSLKPKVVVDAITDYYYISCANIHRGVHALSQEASDLFEEARTKIARFINASDNEIIFVRNATEAIHLVAHCLPLKGDVLTYEDMLQVGQMFVRPKWEAVIERSVINANNRN